MKRVTLEKLEVLGFTAESDEKMLELLAGTIERVRENARDKYDDDIDALMVFYAELDVSKEEAVIGMKMASSEAPIFISECWRIASSIADSLCCENTLSYSMVLNVAELALLKGQSEEEVKKIDYTGYIA